MKKVTRELIVARTIVIDSVENDSVDIKCGGPPWLGFDFTVDADEDMKALKTWLRGVAAKHGCPIQSLHTASKTVEVPKVWSREEMEKEIARVKGWKT